MTVEERFKKRPKPVIPPQPTTPEEVEMAEFERLQQIKPGAAARLVKKIRERPVPEEVAFPTTLTQEGWEYSDILWDKTGEPLDYMATSPTGERYTKIELDILITRQQDYGLLHEEYQRTGGELDIESWHQFGAPLRPVEQIVTSVFPDLSPQDFLDYVEADFDSFMADMRDYTKEKAELLGLIGYTKSQIDSFYGTQLLQTTSQIPSFETWVTEKGFTPELLADDLRDMGIEEDLIPEMVKLEMAELRAIYEYDHDLGRWGTALGELDKIFISDPIRLMDVARVFGQSLLKLPKQVAAAILTAVQGQGGASVVDKDWADRFIEGAGEDLEKFMSYIAEQYPNSQLMTELASLSQNLAFSTIAMGAGLTVGVPIAFAPIPFARVTAYATGTAASGFVAYQMTTYQIMQTYLEFKDAEKFKEFGIGLTQFEEDSLKKEFHSLAVKYGLWEAIPEAISNLAFFTILTAPLSSMLGKNMATQIIAKIAGIYGEELLTEVITQKGQAHIEVLAGLREEEIGWVAAFKEIAPQTFLLTTVMAGAGQVIISSKATISKVQQSLTNEIGANHPQYENLMEHIETDLKEAVITQPEVAPEVVPTEIPAIEPVVTPEAVPKVTPEVRLTQKDLADIRTAVGEENVARISRRVESLIAEQGFEKREAIEVAIREPVVVPTPEVTKEFVVAYHTPMGQIGSGAIVVRFTESGNIEADTIMRNIQDVVSGLSAEQKSNIPSLFNTIRGERGVYDRIYKRDIEQLKLIEKHINNIKNNEYVFKDVFSDAQALELAIPKAEVAPAVEGVRAEVIETIERFKPVLVTTQHQTPFLDLEGFSTNPNIIHNEKARQLIGEPNIGKYMQQTGSIRVSGGVGEINIEIQKMPTAAQFKTLEVMAGDNKINFDISNTDMKVLESGTVDNFADFRTQVTKSEFLKPPVTPEVVKAPPAEVPIEEVVVSDDKGVITPPPDEILPKAVIDNTPIIHDITIKEKVRGTRHVFDKMGIYEIWEGINEAETLVNEERATRRKDIQNLRKSVSKNKERWGLIFDEANETGSVVGLTFEEKRAVNYIRKWANEWADIKNLSQEKRITDYIPHLFEQEMIDQIKERDGISPEIAGVLNERVSRKITDPFLKQRLGAVGFMRDPFRAMEAYDAVSMRVLHYEPFLQRIAAIANDNAMPREAREYLKEFSRRMTGEPSKLDQSINKWFAEMGETIRKLPGGGGLANLLTQGNPAGSAAYNLTSALYTLWLGFKPTSAIRNLSQHGLIIGEVGPLHFASGIAMRFTQEGKNALKKSLVLRGRKVAFVPGIDASFADNWSTGFREKALWLFRYADKQNVSDAFLAGYSEGKSLLPDADSSWWIKRGDEVAADTQYLYTKMNSMAIAQSAPGRVFSMLTTWTGNWIELIGKWITRRPSRVYLQYKEQTGVDVSGENWSTTYKAVLMYLAISALGYMLKEKTRLKALEYTGITSLRYMAGVVGGEFPALEAPGAVATLISGFLTQDDRAIKTGWNEVKGVFTPGIVRQAMGVATGDKDWLQLFLYLEGKDINIKRLKNKWEKGWKPYEDLSDPMVRAFKYPTLNANTARIRWREDNPLLEAQMFVVGQFTTLSSDEARAEVLRLIEEHKLNTDLIDGYEKVFGVDTSTELVPFQNRIGNLEKLVLGEEAEYFDMGSFAEQVHKWVNSQGRSKVYRDGHPLSVLLLDSEDSWEPFEALSKEGKLLYRQDNPDVEATLYLWGKVTAFENPQSAEILLGLMKKYNIPPQAINAFQQDPSKYDELFTQKFELEQKWFDLNTEYENYGNPESGIYIDDKDARKEARDKLKLDNPNWVADMRRIEAIDKDASLATIEAWVDRGKTIDEFGAGSSEAKVWLLDNPETHKWALDQGLLTDDGSDWNEATLRINKTWRVQDEEYLGFGDEDALNYIEDDAKREEARAEYLATNEAYRKDRRRREAFRDEFPDNQIENFVSYYELPVNGFRQERFLLENPEFATAMHNIKGIDIPKPQGVPSVRYDEITEKWQKEFDLWDGLADHKSPHYVEDPDERQNVRNGILFDEGKATYSGISFKTDKLTDFGRATLERQGYYEMVPEKYSGDYVAYYTISKEGKPKDWEDRMETDLWYEDDWFMMEHMNFYREVYRDLLGNEKWDFRTVPSKGVFTKYLVYIGTNPLPDGSYVLHNKARKDYRWENQDLDDWGVLKFEWTPITEQARRAELTPQEKWEEELTKKEKEFEEILEGIK